MSFIQSLHTFVTKTIVSSSKMNENFATIKDAVNDNYSKISANTTSISTLSSSVESLGSSLSTTEGNVTTLQSSLSTLSSDVSSLSSSLTSNVSTLNTSIGKKQSKVNWSGTSNSYIHTEVNTAIAAPCDGWVLLRAKGPVNATFKIHCAADGTGGHALAYTTRSGAGTSMYWEDCNSVFVPIEQNERVIASVPSGKTGYTVIQFFSAKS